MTRWEAIEESFTRLRNFALTDIWRRWVTSYAEQVTVGPAVRGRNRFDPDRVTIEWRQR